MKTAIIACRTLFRELTEVMNRFSCRYPVIWLEAGAHNHPHKRREEILHALLSCREYDTVLLAMAHCGGALEGVTSSTSTLVLPKCDDCITLLLGSEERRSSLPDCYFLSAGWLEGKDNICNEYRRSLERYGPARTSRIFDSMLKNYRYLGYIPTTSENPTDYAEKVHQLAENFQLKPMILEGCLDYLEDLISGNHTPDRFLIIPPGVPITREIDCEKGEDHNVPSSHTAP